MHLYDICYPCCCSCFSPIFHSLFPQKRCACRISPEIPPVRRCSEQPLETRVIRPAVNISDVVHWLFTGCSLRFPGSATAPARNGLPHLCQTQAQLIKHTGLATGKNLAQSGFRHSDQGSSRHAEIASSS